MKWSKYILDRFEEDIAVFLKYPDEEDKLQLHRSKLATSFQEGDIVRISIENGLYQIEHLQEETLNQKDKIQQLLEQLKRK
ncbi:DUF3006 domain-containing protein [Psychrobacillus sp.]|uniref:DUF3006 domain-containing protein n=1 Tax=Psychrobacillus sp. TaxID=1871623 RepID=UPI0028BD9B0E|nr:DUF3006 domain-containing protein [Psychrobacillus sp.]